MATIREALNSARARLRAAEISSPDLDAAVLLASVLEVDRAALYAHPERALPPEAQATYEAMIARRLQGEPVAYISGHKEFMGLDFLTDRRALIPRPETELLVEMALAEIRRRGEAAQTDQRPPPEALIGLRVADIGTGSGAIAIALAVHEPRLPLIYATDISAEALALAEENARRLGAASRLRLLQGDLLEPLPEPVDLLLANLPYIADNEQEILAPDVRDYEPHLALFGADDGLGPIRSLLASAPPLLKPGAVLLLEYGYNQRARLTDLIPSALPGAQIRFISDYAGWDRLVEIRVMPAPQQ
ncbi:MAG TPA: peptide chain release factor N(5)-glutamine methyltransferase [Ktedonobacterales bacterium]|jgi:release factor glutamine methyltransferase